MNHFEVRQKHSSAGRIFNCLLDVSSGDETLRLMLEILLKTLYKRLHFYSGQDLFTSCCVRIVSFLSVIAIPISTKCDCNWKKKKKQEHPFVYNNTRIKVDSLLSSWQRTEFFLKHVIYEVKVKEFTTAKGFGYRIPVTITFLSLSVSTIPISTIKFC